MRHLAIDLETLSLRENAHILTIGAAFFDPEQGSGAAMPSFHVEVARGVEQYGAHVDAGTAVWWMGQVSARGMARFGFGSERTVPLADALREFVAFIDDNVEPNADLLVYQQGSKDADWLVNAGKREGVQLPWRYQNVFCGRTLWAHSPLAECGQLVPVTGTSHNALDDAIWLANRMINVINAMGGRSCSSK